jgi:hypothetical protein
MDGIDRYLNDVTKKEHSTRSAYLHLHLPLIPHIAEPKSRHVTSRHVTSRHVTSSVPRVRVCHVATRLAARRQRTELVS